MGQQDVPTCAAKGIRQVQVLFVAGKTWHQYDYGVGFVTRGDVEDCVQARAVAHNVGGCDVCGELFVWGGIGENRRGHLLGMSGGHTEK